MSTSKNSNLIPAMKKAVALKKEAPKKAAKIGDLVKRFTPWKVVTLLLVAIIFAMHKESNSESYAMLYIMGDNMLKSGRASGNVYQKNGRIRQFRVPALVRNTYTGFVRSQFSFFSSQWNSLTQDQIDAWNAFHYQKTNRFGQSVSVRGKQAFVGINQNLANIGIAVSFDPPALHAPNPIATISGMNWSLAGHLAFLISESVVGVTYIVFATNVKGIGTSKPGTSQFRIIGTIDGTGADITANQSANYVAKFGTPIINDKIFLYCIAVNATTGKPSTGSAVLNCIVTA